MEKSNQKLIDISKIMDLLEAELSEVMADDESYFSSTQFVLSNEQQYVKRTADRKSVV